MTPGSTTTARRTNSRNKSARPRPRPAAGGDFCRAGAATNPVFLANRGSARYQVRALRVAPGRRVWSAAIAQLVEHVIRNDGVTGSSPVCGTNEFKHLGEDIQRYEFLG